MYDYNLRGFCGGHCNTRSSVEGFLKWVNQTQSFTHLTDDVIRGWLLGRLEIEMFGHKSRSRSYYVNLECHKCKGRGWFGHGRPDCPECVAVGKKTTWMERRWNGGRKFTGHDKRRLIWSECEIGLINRASIEMKHAMAFDRAASHSEGYYPSWVDDVQITGKHTDKDKAKYLERIKNQFTFYKRVPKVRGSGMAEHDACHRNIDPNETIARLAMTFGCTCPITGEYIPPDQVATIKDDPDYWDFYDYKYEVGYNLHSLVTPLGFNEHIRIGWRRQTYNCVSPFSKSGIEIIRNASTKCLKALDGKIDNEWVLAEVMQSVILKRAA